VNEAVPNGFTDKYLASLKNRKKNLEKIVKIVDMKIKKIVDTQCLEKIVDTQCLEGRENRGHPMLKEGKGEGREK
jgi:hypothetical protein